MKNQISVAKVDQFSITINEQQFTLSYNEAKILYDLLGKGLNNHNDLTIRYQGEPLYHRPYTPVYGTWPDYNIQPYTVTCSTGETK